MLVRHKNTLCASALILFSAAAATADTWPRNVGEMVHLQVSFDGTAVSITQPVEQNLELRNFSESYTPPADVLDNKGYNDQYGWMASGFWDLPAGSSVWIRVLNQTAGLETYEGGMRSMTPMHTYSPIFGTQGSPDIWQWDGTMTHNWYAASDPGTYQATYSVYIGDDQGTPINGLDSDSITISWQYVPSPATAPFLAFSLLLVSRRRSG